MGRWSGKVIIENNEIEVTVDFIRPSINNFGNWDGYCYSDEFINTATYHTNIGELCVNKVKVVESRYYIEFQGSGMPDGELKEFIGKN